MKTSISGLATVLTLVLASGLLFVIINITASVWQQEKYSAILQDSFFLQQGNETALQKLLAADVLYNDSLSSYSLWYNFIEEDANSASYCLDSGGNWLQNCQTVYFDSKKQIKLIVELSKEIATDGSVAQFSDAASVQWLIVNANLTAEQDNNQEQMSALILARLVGEKIFVWLRQKA